MALAAQQSLLDELMGRGRNAAKGEIIHKYRFDDPNVCKYMLVDYCPHDLFINTRYDLGPCDKIHNLNLREDYRKSSRYEKLGYEKNFEHFLRLLISDVDRRIRRGEERLHKTQGYTNEDSPKTETINKIKCLEDKITINILKSEKLGNDCQIDEAQQVLQECEELREEKRRLEIQLAEEQANKSMELCNICGSFLIVGDIQSRLDEHTSGKQHAGYAKIRETLKNFDQRKGSQLTTEIIPHTQTSDRKRNRSESKEEKSKHHHYRDKDPKQYESSREKINHHHHRSSRTENTSSSNHHYHRR